MDGKFGYYVDNNGNLKKNQSSKRPWEVTNPDTDNKHVTEVWADIRDSENSIIGTMYIDQAVKAVQAVNCHDELVEALVLAQEIFDDIEYSPTCKADGLLKYNKFKQALSKLESEK